MGERAHRLGVREAVVDGVRAPGDVAVLGDRVEAVGLAPAEGARGIAAPGFVDLQVNGFGGVRFTDSGESGYRRAGDALAAAGLVRVAPTILDTSLRGYEEALAVLAEVKGSGADTPYLGAHLEGPNLSASFHGAHDPANFCDGDVSLVQRLTRAGPIAIVTLAPERSGVMEMISRWGDTGVVVSIGHSDADASTCALAAKCGARALTHCWNAHRRLTPRDPGPAGWALADPGVTVGLIADGIHVAREVLALTFSAARGRVALTTDAIAPAGLAGGASSTGDGEGHGPGDRQVVVADGAARLPDGTLAGSVAIPGAMLGVLVGAGVGFEDALHALSVPQRSLLGLESNLLRPGDPGDVTVIDDDHGVRQTWRGGQRVF